MRLFQEHNTKLIEALNPQSHDYAPALTIILQTHCTTLDTIQKTAISTVS